MLTIPEYYKKYIDPNVDLNDTPKVCCPFHDEDTPSFSYSEERGVWKCFGACSVGGDVYSLHQKNKRFKSKAEAVFDLKKLEGEEIVSKEFKSELLKVISYRRGSKVLNDIERLAVSKASCPRDWLEVDYAMSLKSELLLRKFIEHKDR